MKLPSNEFLRFCIVGLINTAVDVPIFVALHESGLSVLVANIISTSLALIVSLLLNYRFTFRSQSLSATRIILYFAVTLTGIWALQPLVIYGLLNLNESIHYTAFLVDRLAWDSEINSLVAKLGSLGFSLVWNYAWYSRVVFRNR